MERREFIKRAGILLGLGAPYVGCAARSYILNYDDEYLPAEIDSVDSSSANQQGLLQGTADSFMNAIGSPPGPWAPGSGVEGGIVAPFAEALDRARDFDANHNGIISPWFGDPISPVITIRRNYHNEWSPPGITIQFMGRKGRVAAIIAAPPDRPDRAHFVPAPFAAHTLSYASCVGRPASDVFQDTCQVCGTKLVVQKMERSDLLLQLAPRVSPEEAQTHEDLFKQTGLEKDLSHNAAGPIPQQCGRTTQTHTNVSTKVKTQKCFKKREP